MRRMRKTMQGLRLSGSKWPLFKLSRLGLVAAPDSCRDDGGDGIGSRAAAAPAGKALRPLPRRRSHDRLLQSFYTIWIAPLACDKLCRAAREEIVGTGAVTCD